MTELERAQLRASEIRTRLAELAAVPELDDEQRSELDTLRTEYGDVERRVQALTIAGSAPGDGDGDGDGETESRESDPELEALLAAANIGDIYEAALSGRPTDGETRELQEHYGLEETSVPLAMLGESRAEGNNTDAPAAGSRGASQAPIIDYVFPQAVATFLNVPQPTVPVGERVYTVLSTAASAGTPALEADQAVSTAAFSAEVLSPARIQAALAYRIEDRASLRGMDEALRSNLRGALADKLDAQVVAKLLAEGQDVDLTGTKPYTFATFHDALYGGVDGRYAGGVGSVRAVLGADVYRAAAGFYRTANSEFSAIDELTQRGGGVRVSAHIPAIAAKKAKAIYRVGTRMDAVAPIWEGVEIIADRVTQAKAGQTLLTAVMLYNVDVLRKAPIRVVEFQNAA